VSALHLAAELLFAAALILALAVLAGTILPNLPAILRALKGERP
jgi:hypothetical protein